MNSTCRFHIIASHSAHLEISGCYIHDAKNIGDGGYGYGVALQRATCFSLVENNSFRRLRHAMLVQGGANSNVFSYNYSSENIGKFTYAGIEWDFEPPDLCLHGRYPFANLFEHNIVNDITADNSHKNGSINNGPFNTFMRCYSKKTSLLLKGAPHSNIEGCNVPYSLVTYGGTSKDLDLYGKWPRPGYGSYDNYPEVNHETYANSQDFFKRHCTLLDKSYYYTEKPYFLSTGDEYPSIGPPLGTINGPLSDIIPAFLRNTIYISKITLWPPDPLTLNISGPTYLDYMQNGTFTANPSGGSGTYSNYRWWWRNDDSGGGPSKSANDINLDSGGGIKYAPPGGTWYILSGQEGKKTITIAKPASFSLKCEVTDSTGDTDTDEHSIVVDRGKSLAKKGDMELDLVKENIPDEYDLIGSYPNPFNPSTTIKYALPVNSKVNISIYNLTGQRIRNFEISSQSAGIHQIFWNGKNNFGGNIPSGMYLVNFTAASNSPKHEIYTKSMKIIMLK